MLRVAKLLVWVVPLFACMAGCGQSKPEVDPAVEAQQKSLDQQRKQLDLDRQKLAMQNQPQQQQSPTMPATEVVNDPTPHPASPPPRPTSPSSYSSQDVPPDKVAKDGDIETALSLSYAKTEDGGRYTVTGEVTNTGSAIAPFVHVYVRMKGFAIETLQAVGGDETPHNGPAEKGAAKMLGGEYETEVAVLRNVLPGQSRAVNAVFDEPSVDAISGLEAGQSLKSGRSAENTFRTTVSDS